MPRSLVLSLTAALALSPGLAAAQAPPRCTVQGPSVEIPRAEVHPEGAAPFTLEVRGAEVEARPPGSGDLHLIEVRAGLRFAAESPGADLPYRLTRRVQTAHGMVELSPNVRLSHVRARAADVRLEAEPTEGVHLLHLEVPCAALGLGGRAPGAEQPAGGPSGALWISRSKHLILHSRPGGGATLMTRVEEPARWQLREVGRSSGWLLLRWAGSEGTQVEGWVPRGEVEPPPNVGYGSSRCGAGLARCGRVYPSDPEVYRGPARVRAGAEVFAAPGRGRWATASSSEPLRVVHTRGEAWVRITVVPHLAELGECDELAHAWVRLADVELPPDAHPPPPP